MDSSVGVVVRALRVRQGEIEQAVFARVREVVPAPADDPQYLDGLRGAVAGAVEYCFVGLERGEGFSAEIPAQAVAQAQRAARRGVSVDAVLRRYIVGNALLCDYIMQECDSVELRGLVSGRELLRAQSVQLDRLVIGVTREHVAELQRAGRSREHRLLERVRSLLAGEDADRDSVSGSGRHDLDLDYDLGGEHLGVIARGAGAERALRGLALELDRRLLSVVPARGTVWAWLGGQRSLQMSAVQRAVGGAALGDDAAIATGEPAAGYDGWRLSHRQAQAAMLIAARRPGALTRYGDVSLLATVLKDEVLARTLIEIYVAPLDNARDGGVVLRRTLRAYFETGRNVSSTAAVLSLARSTVVSRLRTVEELLGRTLDSCLAELEVALGVEELGGRVPASRILTDEHEFT
jgi:hypothetical protein